MSYNLTSYTKYVQQRSAAVSCPGLYCGKTVLGSGELSECSACPRGSRPDPNDDICHPCVNTLFLYDWMYLAFMALLPLILNGAILDMVFRNWRKHTYVLLQLSNLCEAALAAFLTIVLFRSKEDGSFSIKSCGVNRLTDWYTLFFNPKPDYVNSVRCTQEIVYPLYSMVFAYIFFSLIFMLAFRGLLARSPWSHDLAKNAILASLYQYPVWLVMHACLAGVIYYVFPYASVVLSVVSSTVQYAITPDQTVSKLCRKLFTSPHSLTILLLHWLVLAFGVLSLAHFPSLIASYAVFLSCIPVPTVVYISTIRFTDPTKYYDYFE
ncbi:putative JNK1/MAPK8-associated membrane protein [Hypsibius exemplaris]|uniref:JNK1/MAPK8-associated membrane protein n=1 Tax=Hypsibius exemplaris TaxID=2072580 RepID=A0A1W0WUL1_HYPEX|nr:putative JNK1/MAPK8-associated membrane protein [Hypsibius exemplaris]